MDGVGAALGLAVLPAKVDPPRRVAGAIERRAVLDRIAASPARVVVVVAPAGYGKTTILHQVVAHATGPTGWVTADRSDEDPVGFAHAVVQALGDGVPMQQAEDRLARPGPAVWRELLPDLAGSLRRAPRPFVLVVDDVHELHDDRTVALLDDLLDAVPDGSRIVLGGRALPPIRLGRRRLSEPVLELGVDDLAFSIDEARVALDAARAPGLPESIVTELFDRTEGWPAGLHLARIALQGQPDPEQALRSLIARGGNLADYIQQELLAGATSEDRRFLLETSVLERLNAPLCEAVTGVPGAGVRLERFVRDGNLFVVPLATDATYRYHHLFGELLVAELRRTDPGLEATLHRRAAEWLVADGDGEGALRHALASGDLDHAAEVLYRLFFDAIGRGALATLERWLSWFPPAELRCRPSLLVVQAWTAASRGRTAEVAELLDRLDGASADGPLPDGTVSVSVAAAATRVLAGRDGVKAMARWAQVVIDAGPDGSPWWGFAAMQRAVALHLAGTDEDPVALFDAAARATRGDGAVHAVTLAHCGLVRLQQGDEAGHALVDDAVAELVASGSEDQPLAAMVFSARACSSAGRGRLDESLEAEARAERCIAHVGDAIPRGVAHNRLVLADAALARRDLPAAARQLAAAQEMLPHEPDAARLHEWADRVAQRTSARRRADGETEWSQLSPAELRVLAELRTHRSLEEIGVHLYVSRNTVKSHTIAIYRKLGVSGRSAAVARAAELDLFPT